MIARRTQRRAVQLREHITTHARAETIRVARSAVLEAAVDGLDGSAAAAGDSDWRCALGVAEAAESRAVAGEVWW